MSAIINPLLRVASKPYWRHVAYVAVGLLVILALLPNRGLPRPVTLKQLFAALVLAVAALVTLGQLVYFLQPALRWFGLLSGATQSAFIGTLFVWYLHWRGRQYLVSYGVAIDEENV